ncbi:MAG: porin family protein [Bacteroidia bacterium]
MRKNINLLKLSTSVFLILILASKLIAQQPLKYSFGLRFEPNINWLTIDNKRIQSNKINADFNFGIFANKHINEKFYIGSGVNILNQTANIKANNVFVQNKFKGADSSIVNSFNIQYRLRYFEIPFILTMNTREMHNKTYYAEAGLSSAFLIRAKANIDADGFKNIKNVSIQNPDDEDNYVIRDADNRNTSYNQEIFPVRFAGVIGAGAKFGVLINSYVTTGLRFNIGLNNVFKEERWQSTNNFMSLNLGFVF